MPDIFVPQDTVGFTSYLIEVNSKGLIQQYCFRYSDTNRAALSKITNEADMADYLHREGIVEQFIRFAETKGVKRRNLLINKSRKLLERYLCNNIIYNILGMEAHIRYLNKGDETVQKALEVLEKGEAFPKPEAQLSITQNNPV